MAPGIAAGAACDVHAVPRVALIGWSLVQDEVSPVLVPRVHRVPGAFLVTGRWRASLLLLYSVKVGRRGVPKAHFRGVFTLEIMPRPRAVVQLGRLEQEQRRQKPKKPFEKNCCRIPSYLA